MGLPGKPGNPGKAGVTGLPGMQGSFGPKVRMMNGSGFFHNCCLYLSRLIQKELTVKLWYRLLVDKNCIFIANIKCEIPGQLLSWLPCLAAIILNIY